MKKLLGFLLVILSPVIIIVGAYLLLTRISGPPAPIAEANRESVFQQQQHETIPYTASTRTSEQKGGIKVIVIDQTNNNEKDLTTLGQQLRGDTGKDAQASIAVFDDAQAAGNYDANVQHRLSQSDQDAFNKHFVALFTKKNSMVKFELLRNGDINQPSKVII